jgi:excisionase family DNA binding protein
MKPNSSAPPLNREHPRHPDNPTFLDRQQTAQQLSVSVTTVDRLVKSGQLRAARIGRRVVVSPQAIAAFRVQAETEEWGTAS